MREHAVVRAFYGERRAERSGVPYMNHIDEGLRILDWLGASEDAKRAFCLHPLVQGDGDLAVCDLCALTDAPRVMALTMEYRSVANAYLSPHGERAVEDVRLSPLSDVNDMLRADKVQNYKDFLSYHANTHPRSAALDRYFKTWLERLGVAEDTFAEFAKRLGT